MIGDTLTGAKVRVAAKMGFFELGVTSMNSRPSNCSFSLLCHAVLVGWLCLAICPAHAQYKVVGPDGKVTYTDRSPNSTDSRITSLKDREGPQVPDVELPFELRQVVAKYPVTLYSASNACEPCATARQLLRQRGIPYSERLIVAAEDNDALERLSGGREVPTLTIGAQVLRGLSTEAWGSYLDAAGYPHESRLPSNYQYKAAAPIVERRDAAPGRTASSASSAANRPAPTPATPGGIRF